MISYHSSPLDQPGTGDSGGMNVYVRRLAASLARRGVTCDIFTRRSDGSTKDELTLEPGLTLHHVEAGPTSHVDKEELLEYVPTFTEGVLDNLGSSKGGPVDLVHSNYWLSGIAGHAIKHELAVPLFTSFHTLERAKEMGRVVPDDRLDPSVRIMHEQRIMGCSDAVLVSCAPEGAWATSLYGAKVAQVKTIPLGVDTAYFSPGTKEMARRALGLPLSKKIILAVGRIQALKGFTLGVEAVSMLESELDAYLVIVGGPSGHDGQLELERIKDLAKERGLEDRVRLVPPQPHEILSSFYRACDIVIVPSRSESFGLVALEAGACGRPVVASQVGGLPSLVEDGISGLLVSERSAESFARALRRLLSDDDLADSMGRVAHYRSAGYTWSESARRLMDLHEELSQGELLRCG